MNRERLEECRYIITEGKSIPCVNIYLNDKLQSPEDSGIQSYFYGFNVVSPFYPKNL